MIILYLTCANDAEAIKISNELLESKLIACARFSHVKSSYWWDGEIHNDDETLLMMESAENKFDDIESVVTRLHSYEAYVLTAVAVTKTTPGVLRWINDSTQ